MRQKKGFTLIELLVVIAIIALLLAILMPSLKTAKKIAQSIVCSSNNKTLSLGAALFANDYEDVVLNSSPTGSSNGDEKTVGWVTRPRDLNDSAVNATNATFEDRTRGIAGGTLYPYIENFKSYHCPGDRRFSTNFHNYLSYSMPGCLNPNTKDTTKYITKFSQIRQPSEKYIFLEESDPRPYFSGSWSFGTKEHGRDGWWDGLAIWHNNSSTFGFADGHAEGHKWRDDYTRTRAGWTYEELMARGGTYGYMSWPNTAYEDVRNDLNWMQAHWPFSSR